jgi:hypothetical protein
VENGHGVPLEQDQDLPGSSPSAMTRDADENCDEQMNNSIFWEMFDSELEEIANARNSYPTTETRSASTQEMGLAWLVVHDKENFCQPSVRPASALAGMQGPLREFQDIGRDTKKFNTSGLPIIKPMKTSLFVGEESNKQHVSTALQDLSNDVSVAARCISVVVSRPTADNNNNNNSNENINNNGTKQDDWEALSLQALLFDNTSHDLRKVPVLDATFLAERVNGKLFPHQVAGTSWMVNQETKEEKDAIPPFYTITANGRYGCTLSK